MDKKNFDSIMTPNIYGLTKEIQRFIVDLLNFFIYIFSNKDARKRCYHNLFHFS